MLRRNRIQLKPTIENWGGRRTFHPTGAEEEDDSYAPSDTPPDNQEEGGMSAAVVPLPTARESSQETERVMPKPILRQSTRKRTPTDFFQAGSRK